MEFAHVCVSVDDLDRSRQFYVEELGLEPVDAPGPDLFVEAGNGIPIQLREGTDDGNGTLDHLAFVVSDVNDAVETVDHSGLERAPEDLVETGVRTAFVRDPDGISVELIEYLD